MNNFEEMSRENNPSMSETDRDIISIFLGLLSGAIFSWLFLRAIFSMLLSNLIFIFYTILLILFVTSIVLVLSHLNKNNNLNKKYYELSSIISSLITLLFMDMPP